MTKTFPYLGKTKTKTKTETDTKTKHSPHLANPNPKTNTKTKRNIVFTLAELYALGPFHCWQRASPRDGGLGISASKYFLHSQRLLQLDISRFCECRDDFASEKGLEY